MANKHVVRGSLIIAGAMLIAYFVVLFNANGLFSGFETIPAQQAKVVQVLLILLFSLLVAGAMMNQSLDRNQQ